MTTPQPGSAEMPAFPVHDPQFWIATLAFILAAAWLLRGLLPIPLLSRRARAARSSRKVRLTISATAAPPPGGPRRSA